MNQRRNIVKRFWIRIKRFKTTEWIKMKIQWSWFNFLSLFKYLSDGIKSFGDILKKCSKAVGQFIKKIALISYKFLAKKGSGLYSGFKVFMKKHWRKIIFILASILLLILFIWIIGFGATWLWNSANSNDSIRSTITPWSVGVFFGFFIFLILAIRLIVRRHETTEADGGVSSDKEEKGTIAVESHWDKMMNKKIAKEDDRRSGFIYNLTGFKLPTWGKCMVTAVVVMYLIPIFGEALTLIVAILYAIVVSFMEHM